MSDENGSISSFSEDDKDSLCVEEELPECCENVLGITNACKHLPYDHYINALDLLRTHNASKPFPTSGIYSNAMVAIFAHFHREFPLSDTMHLEWMEQQIQSFTIARNGEMTLLRNEFLMIRELYEGACGDYWSVDVVLWYLEKSQQTEECDRKCVEEDLIKAVDTIGLYYSRGDEIWRAFREWYTQWEEDVDIRIARIDALYRRQLQIPLEKNDLVLSEYRSWYTHNAQRLSIEKNKMDPLEEVTSTQRMYNRSFGKKLAHFEHLLIENLKMETEKPGSLEQSWLAYLDFVQFNVISVIDKRPGHMDEEGDLGLKVMQAYYERAIKDICMSSSIWIRYIQYLKKHNSATLCQLSSTCERSVRNVFMDSSLWCQCILVLEQNQEYDRLDQFLNDQLLERQSPQNPVMDEHHAISVLLMYCDTARRRCFDSNNRQGHSYMQNAFTKSIQFFNHSYPTSSVYHFHLQSYRLHCKFLVEEQGRTLVSFPSPRDTSAWEEGWEEILASRPSQAAVWIQYYQSSLIRRHIRSSQADPNNTKINPTIVVYPSLLGIQAVRKRCFERAVESVQDTPLLIFEAWLTFEREHGDLSSFLRVRDLYTEALTQQLQTAEVPQANSEEKPHEIPSRKRSRDHHSKSSLDRRKLKKAKAESSKAAITPNDPNKHSADPRHTLFVSNIDKEVTEDQLRSIFSDSAPNLQSVRLVAKKRAHGLKSRGFAYVSFLDEESCQTALQLDGMVVKGKPVRIHSYDVSTGTSFSLTHSEDSAMRTLYIGNLQRILASDTIRGNASALKSVLQDAISQVVDLSELEEIYVPQEQRGNRHAKKYALVEFSSEDALDGILSDEKQEQFRTKICSCVSVSAEGKDGCITLKRSKISIGKMKQEPEKKRRNPRGQSGRKVHLTETNIPAQRLILTDLRPRSIQHQKKEKKESPSGSEEKTTVESTTRMKSNQDFRALFLAAQK
uniref:Uncharacterized protein AlNc14C174G8091 n=1 Tax=Albugo laibachii Nc14 TaxID=890382 RepID=F0WNT2_9STRA|nr:conserved hypothetical protein [Albugo laibachii Nc14]|eukprot:CCA22974.1 conserved hypothetical protein [Albugo laibachii Nc14]